MAASITRPSLKYCVAATTTCAQTSNHAIDLLRNPARAPSVRTAVDAIGADNYVLVVARSDVKLARLDALIVDARALGRTEAQIGGLVEHLATPSSLGAAEETLDKLTSLHRAYRDNPRVTPAEALQVLEDAGKLAHARVPAGSNYIPGLDDWLKRARSQANSADNYGYRGYTFEARRLAELADNNELVEIGIRHEHVVNGRTVRVQTDACRASDHGDVLQEYKAGDVGLRYVPQLARQAEYVSLTADAEGYARVLEWRIGGTATSSFQSAANAIASQRDLTIRLLDGDGNAIAVFVPG